MKSKTPGLTKYIIGLGIILLFTVGLVAWLAMQAGTVRADNKTYEAAQKIGSDLEYYISKNNKLPTKLSEATKKAVPAEVTYKKLSSSRYQFCVTYKAASSDFSTSNVQAEVLSRAYGMNMTGGSSGSTYEDEYLYLSPSHTAGKNCQTIKPYIVTASDDLYNSDYFGGDCKYDSTKPNSFEEYYTCLEQSSSDTTDSTQSI